MLHIRINHITKNGKIDFIYDYNDIPSVLHDIDIIKDKCNYRVSIYDDKESTEEEATYYSPKIFKYLYGGGEWEKEQQVDLENDQTLKNSTSFTTTKASQLKNYLPFGE